jgi:1-phosphofructokinase
VIVTVTPNPSVDRTLRIPPLVRGDVNRASAATSEAGGKGINVARALATQGHATLAVAPLSPASTGLMRALLADAAPLEAVPVRGEVRVNVSLVEADGTVTKVNEPGPRIDADEVEALLAGAAEHAMGATWIAGCGSLAPGMPPDFYARLARRAPPGVRVAIDADGEALAKSRAAPVALVKPNLAELERLVGRHLETLGDVVGAARELVAGGIASVLVSLGSDGAVLVEAGRATHVEAAIDDVVNTVGAGDALLAGYLAAGGGVDGLAGGVAWSVAACRSPGTQMRSVTPGDREAVRVHPAVDAGRRLRR